MKEDSHDQPHQARLPLQHGDRRHPSSTRVPGSVADVLVDPHLPTLARKPPINVYVIEHADGVVVFDTGQDRASVTDPSYFPDGANAVIYRRLARFHVSQDETLTAGLARLGYSTGDVTTAVVSHLQQDHIVGIGEIPAAELLVSDGEWRSLHRPMPETRGLLRAHINVPHAKWRPITYQPLDDPTSTACSSALVYSSPPPGSDAIPRSSESRRDRESWSPRSQTSTTTRCTADELRSVNVVAGGSDRCWDASGVPVSFSAAGDLHLVNELARRWHRSTVATSSTGR